MNTVVGFLLVMIATATVGIVLYLVSQEKHDHEEHYFPPTAAESQALEALMIEASVDDPARVDAEPVAPVADDSQPTT